MVIIKKEQITRVVKNEEKGTLVHNWWDIKLVQPLWKTVWKFFKELKTELPCDPIPLLDIYSKKTITLIQKYMCTLMFIVALFTTAKIWKQPRCLLMNE